jgi:hypothetical protein
LFFGDKEVELIHQEDTAHDKTKLGFG